MEHSPSQTTKCMTLIPRLVKINQVMLLNTKTHMSKLYKSNNKSLLATNQLPIPQLIVHASYGINLSG